MDVQIIQNVILLVGINQLKKKCPNCNGTLTEKKDKIKCMNCDYERAN